MRMAMLSRSRSTSAESALIEGDEDDGYGTQAVSGTVVVVQIAMIQTLQYIRVPQSYAMVMNSCVGSIPSNERDDDRWLCRVYMG